jgi:acetyltransferase-like isoleucine patch superfamily enzyme
MHGAARGLLNRILQIAARFAPGAKSTRVWLHRLRGVKIGRGAFIGLDALIGTTWPDRIVIGDGSVVGIRTVIIDHWRGTTSVERGRPGPSVEIGERVFVGPGVIVLPNVKIGSGAVVCAGSVVTRSVPPLTMVQGNPARPIAVCGVPLGIETPLDEFQRNLRPMRRGGGKAEA